MKALNTVAIAALLLSQALAQPPQQPPGGRFLSTSRVSQRAPPTPINIAPARDAPKREL